MDRCEVASSIRLTLDVGHKVEKNGRKKRSSSVLVHQTNLAQTLSDEYMKFPCHVQRSGFRNVTVPVYTFEKLLLSHRIVFPLHIMNQYNAHNNKDAEKSVSLSKSPALDIASVKCDVLFNCHLNINQCFFIVLHLVAALKLSRVNQRSHCHNFRSHWTRLVTFLA
ncbi:hypothetical protein JOB18_031808 [Solea senegalensis]|uniref:Uncharacterized protein n=1 Tax=Solea senegalensis TaxID=28829 RepID=A0AAV6T079_SOLSE|nr:hypothetical protein JOB18_031808 [Solea senegalensis]